MVDFAENTSALSIGLFGGGRGAMQLFDFFASSSLATVRFVVDPDPGAPAMAAARAKRIPAFVEFEEALRQDPVDFIIETTGLAGFESQLAERLAGTPTAVLSHRMAGLMVQVMSEHKRRSQVEVSAIIQPIKAGLAAGLQGSQAIVGQINQVMSSMQMLTLNAGIEASKAGSLGRGFAVVADQMGKSVETVRKLTQEIEDVNHHIVQVSDQIDSVLDKLR